MCPNKYKEIWNKITYLVEQKDDDEDALWITEKCINKYKELWNKIKYLIKQKDDDDNYMKFKINSDDDLPLNRQKILYDVVILTTLPITHKYFGKRILE